MRPPPLLFSGQVRHIFCSNHVGIEAGTASRASVDCAAAAAEAFHPRSLSAWQLTYNCSRALCSVWFCILLNFPGGRGWWLRRYHDCADLVAFDISEDRLTATTERSEQAISIHLSPFFNIVYDNALHVRGRHL